MAKVGWTQGGALLLTVATTVLWPAKATAAEPTCQMMTLQTSSGRVETLMCKDDDGKWYEAKKSDASALPPRARMGYQGDYNLTVSTPQKMRRNPTLGDLANAIGGNTKKMQGSIKFSLTREGNALSGTLESSGASPPRNNVTGTIQGSVCKLYTNEVLYEGTCDRNGFSGRLSSTGAVSQSVKGTFQAVALTIVDVSEEDRLAAIAKAERDRQAAIAKEERRRKAPAEFATLWRDFEIVKKRVNAEKAKFSQAINSSREKSVVCPSARPHSNATDEMEKIFWSIASLRREFPGVDAISDTKFGAYERWIVANRKLVDNQLSICQGY